MKTKNILSIFATLLIVLGLAACEGEKDLIIIEGDLPIKTSTLYMVGDATPSGWSLDAATPLVATADDPLVFEWEGPLNSGEMKLSLSTSSWDVPFIRPLNNGDEITKAGVEPTKFAMHAGDPDDKWVVRDAGIYKLSFNLREWTMSAGFIREQDAPEIEPIEAATLYIVGDATPNGWDLDNATSVEKRSDYTFVYEGVLYEGELKACVENTGWDVPFIRPSSDGCQIDENGVEASDFLFSTSPDNKWRVLKSGVYRLTFNLKDWTISAEYTADFRQAPKLYMIGEATDGGWSWDAATVIEATAENENIFVWEGELGRGTFKAAREKDFGAPFYRPSSADCTVSESGVSSTEMVYTTDPDDQWSVAVAGRYRLTYNTEAMTFNAEFISE